MNIFETYLKFTDRNGNETFVSIYQYTQEHQDTYQDDMSEVLFNSEFEPI
jgi:hypothetical protein